jgi:hypothetical protein
MLRPVSLGQTAGDRWGVAGSEPVTALGARRLPDPAGPLAAD